MNTRVYLKFWPDFMKKFFLGCLCIAGIVGCQSAEKPALDSQFILQKTFEAHGGLENWDRLESLQFEKEYRLFREDGSLESEAVQQHNYQFDSGFSATITWEQNGFQHRIEHTPKGTQKWVNDSLVTDTTVIQSAHNSALAARFTGTQSFQLLAPGTRFIYEGRDTLDNGSIVHVVKAEYDSESQDTWWHYFDKETGQCLGNLIYHAPTFALVENLSFDQHTPFLFHNHRKTFRVDSFGNKQYLRAEYWYRNYKMVRW